MSAADRFVQKLADGVVRWRWAVEGTFDTVKRYRQLALRLRRINGRQTGRIQLK